MAGEQHDPYRPPCPGQWPSPPIYWLGGRWQHFKAAENGLPSYRNISQVANYANPADVPTPPATIAPYSRPSAPAVFNATGCANPLSSGGLGEPKIDQWPLAERATGSGGDGGFTVDNNIFQLIVNQVYDAAQCVKHGFKAVLARRYFYGRKDFLQRQGCATPMGEDCHSCVWEPVRGLPSQTKYLTIRIAVDQWELIEDEPITENARIDRHWDRTYSVNKDSGVVSLVAGSEYGTTNFPDEAPISRELLGVPGTYLGVDNCGKNHYVELAKQANIDAAAGEDPFVAWTIGETLTATGYSATLAQLAGDEAETPIAGVTISYELSDPYSADEVYADLKALAAYWPLNDDAVYQWRADGYLTVVPLVTRRHVVGAVNPEIWTPLQVTDVNGKEPGDVGYIDTPWTDPARLGPGGALQDGSIKGKPNPAGAQHFDYDHLTMRVCQSPFDDQYVWYPSHDGAYSGQPNNGDGTDAVMPVSATQWLDNRTAGTNLPKAFLRYAAGSATAELQKYAEIKETWPSYDFFGPWGAQRFAMDETLVRCVSATAKAGTMVTLTVDILMSGSAADGGTFRGRICGVSAELDGIWTVTKTAADTYTIDTSETRLVCGDDMEATCTGVIGKLRWPDAWPIGGRIAVASEDFADGVMTIKLAESAPYLRTGDLIDFTTSGGVTLVSGLAVTVIDASTITVASEVRTDFIKSGGAPDYWWHDTGAKGDYLVFTATHDFRDYAEADRFNVQVALCNCAEVGPAVPALRTWQGNHGVARSVKSFTVAQGCGQFLPCCPTVVCISPNEGDVFVNGATYGFPGSLVTDDDYGWLWQGWIEQMMANPLWQVPHRPCAGGAEDFSQAWAMDDGSCTGQYAHWPPVESRITVPAGAPALPAGVAISYLTLVELDVETLTAIGKVISLPVAPGNNLQDSAGPPFGIDAPWGVLLRATTCVASGGAFAGDYGAFI